MRDRRCVAGELIRGALDHHWTKRRVLDGLRVRWTQRLDPGTGGLELRVVGVELQAIDVGAQVVGREVTIHVDREAGIAVAQDRCTATVFAPAIMSKLAVVCRRS